jgi:recombination protein RecR
MTDSRHKNLICVVEDIRDLLAIENIGNYRGSFHVLGGVISPMDGVGPSDLFITTLVDRMGEIKGDVEIIFALPATMEGDTTAFYLYKKLKDFEGVKITSLARGVAVGEALQHADEATLSRSLDNRTIYQA